MADIISLSKFELMNNNEKLVQELFITKGYAFNKISDGKIRTKYNIHNEKENYTIKIMGYRYNEKNSGNYAYVLKHCFDLDEYNFLFFVLYCADKVYILKIPPCVFRNPAPNSAFKNRDYEKGKSAPEYGIIMNKKTFAELLSYEEFSSCNHFSLCNK